MYKIYNNEIKITNFLKGGYPQTLEQVLKDNGIYDKDGNLNLDENTSPLFQRDIKHLTVFTKYIDMKSENEKHIKASLDEIDRVVQNNIIKALEIINPKSSTKITKISKGGEMSEEDLKDYINTTAIKAAEAAFKKDKKPEKQEKSEKDKIFEKNILRYIVSFAKTIGLFDENKRKLLDLNDYKKKFDGETNIIEADKRYEYIFGVDRTTLMKKSAILPDEATTISQLSTDFLNEELAYLNKKFDKMEDKQKQEAVIQQFNSEGWIENKNDELVFTNKGLKEYVDENLGKMKITLKKGGASKNDAKDDFVRIINEANDLLELYKEEEVTCSGIYAQITPELLKMTVPQYGGVYDNLNHILNGGMVSSIIRLPDMANYFRSQLRVLKIKLKHADKTLSEQSESQIKRVIDQLALHEESLKKSFELLKNANLLDDEEIDLEKHHSELEKAKKSIKKHAAYSISLTNIFDTFIKIQKELGSKKSDEVKYK